MDSAKKWHIHSAGRKTGPFSADDIKNKLMTRALGPDAQLSTDDQPAPRRIIDIPEFKSVRATAPDELSALMEIRPEHIDDSTGALDMRELKIAKKEAAKAAKLVTHEARRHGHAPKRSGTPMAVVIVVCVALGGAWFLRDSLTSGVTKIPGVSEEEMTELSKAAKAAPGTQPAVGLALASTSASSQTLHVSANLPDGSELEILARGAPETLLAPQQDVRLKLKLQKYVAGTPVLRVSPGEYDVTVFKDGSPAATKRYFLGGARDARYAAAIGEIRNKRKATMTAELKRLNEIANELGALLDDSARTAPAISKNTNKKKQAAAWKEFHARWSGTHGIVGKKIQEPHSQFQSLFAATRTFWEQLGQIHSLRDPVAAAEARAEAAEKQAITSLAQLKTALAEEAKKVGQ